MATKTKNKTATELKKNKPGVVQINWEKILADGQFLEAIGLLGAMLNKRKWRPCVRHQVLNQLNTLTTLLIAMDGEYKETLRLLDKDCVGGSVVGQFVKPRKRKKVVSRR